MAWHAGSDHTGSPGDPVRGGAPGDRTGRTRRTVRHTRYGGNARPDPADTAGHTHGHRVTLPAARTGRARSRGPCLVERPGRSAAQ
eukprot:134698-Hanusia_phi.AAC.1